ncbi:MAG: hypothetical protein JWP48_4040, partial [Actinoallomurus sp.]|nr:hypothetical protein [Actinoallomurus sp.]
MVEFMVVIWTPLSTTSILASARTVSNSSGTCGPGSGIMPDNLVGCGYSITAVTSAFFLRLGCGPVLVDQAIEDLLASEPGYVEVGGSCRPGRLWWSPVSCPMRAMLVVVPFVLGEYATQVAFAVD